MSEQENIESLLRAIELWNQGDVEAVVAAMDPEVEYRPSQDMPDVEPVYRGREGVREFFRGFVAPWETISVEASHPVAKGDEVVVGVRFIARGRDGIEVDIATTHHYTVRDGPVVAFRSYPERAPALAAAGIE